MEPKVIIFRPTVEAGEDLELTARLHFKRVGFYRIVAILEADGIQPVKRMKIVEITDVSADKERYFWL